MCAHMCDYESVFLWELRTKKSQKQMQNVKCGTLHTLFLPVCFESENIRRERIKPFAARRERELQFLNKKGDRSKFPKEKINLKVRSEYDKMSIDLFVLRWELSYKMSAFLRLPLLKNFLSVGGVERWITRLSGSLRDVLNLPMFAEAPELS